MVHKIIWPLILTLYGSLTLIHSTEIPKESYEFWGFYGHRVINRTAVFTLPIELIPLYKNNIEFITEHSIDPDKRRYAAPLEAVRHYIDLDHWGDYPFEMVPRDFCEAMVKYGQIHLISSPNDTVVTWSGEELNELLTESRKNQIIQELRIDLYGFLDNGFLTLPNAWIPKDYQDQKLKLIFTEYFSEYGILPYHLNIYQARLTNAFKNRDWPLAIRLSTEMGHYLSDAHVPLHTTENYNGQLTGQDGIHAFWESRIPELFAEEEYDFFVGRSKYIEDTDDFFWDIILESHSYVDEVLSTELELRNSFSKDRQYCFEERGAVTTRVECREYARAYQDAMSGMVEDRMRKSIVAIGSSWYTAWVDGGKPKFENLTKQNSYDTILLMNIDTLAIATDTIPN